MPQANLVDNGAVPYKNAVASVVHCLSTLIKSFETWTANKTFRPPSEFPDRRNIPILASLRTKSIRKNGG
ncbi:hypothetical protein EMIT07CA2_10708 [Brevibacillus sp. IT-7CA2]